jgi:hypothetical protein
VLSVFHFSENVRPVEETVAIGNISSLYMFVAGLEVNRGFKKKKKKKKRKKEKNSVASVCERTIQNERLSLVGEVSANFCG